MPKAKKVSEKKRVEFTNLLITNDEAKKYSKSFNGVRNLLLSGKDDKEINLTTLEVKVLKATKDKKSSVAYVAVKVASEMKADYTDKNGKAVKYSDIWSKWSVLNAVRNIVNSDSKMAELAIKF